MLPAPTIVRLRDQLLAGGYALEAVSERLGNAALAGLGRNSAVPAEEAIAGQADPQADLIRLWLLGQPLAQQRLSAVLPDWADLLQTGLLIAEGDQLRATVEIKPHGDDDFSGWICSDRTGLDGRSTQPRTDFVLGASPASTTLTQLTPRAQVGSALDLGTGCGVQTLHLAAHSDRIVATDLNPRALELARITTGLSGVEVDFRLGSLYEPVETQRFDLIVTNPPYVISPPGRNRLIYREGAEVGDGLMRRVVTEAPERLNAGGTLVVLGNWAITDQAWDARLAEWLATTGCDALVMQREVLDPYEYIELWLADAGLVGSSSYAARYAEWLGYLTSLGIRGVGMGWLALRNAGREDPQVRIEDWPHAVHQPVGTAFAEFFDAAEPSRLTDEQLLGTHLALHPELIQEALGLPGAANPQHLILRQHYGFGRAVEPGTALAAVVGACDGDLALGALISAVASLTEADHATLQIEVLAGTRRLISESFLLPDRRRVAVD